MTEPETLMKSIHGNFFFFNFGLYITVNSFSEYVHNFYFVFVVSVSIGIYILYVAGDLQKALHKGPKFGNQNKILIL